jgi:ethanolaminephosphotransferase
MTRGVWVRVQMKMIYGYVTKTEFPMGTVLMLPLLLGAANANAQAWFGVCVHHPWPCPGRSAETDARTRRSAPWMPLAYEPLFLRVYAVVAAAQYLAWAVAIIDAFCAHLRIRAFAIPAPPVPKKAA